MTTQTQNKPAPEETGSAGYLALVLAWLIPGLGHFILGEKARGIIFAVTIHGLFALGMLIAGIRAINPPDQQIWGYTQWMAGWPRAVTYSIERQKSAEYDQLIKNYPDRGSKLDDDRFIEERKEYGKEFIKEHPIMAYHPKIQDIGAVYCGIAGMLNMLVIFDVLLRITGSTRQTNTGKTAATTGEQLPPKPADGGAA